MKSQVNPISHSRNLPGQLIAKHNFFWILQGRVIIYFDVQFPKHLSQISSFLTTYAKNKIRYLRHIAYV